MTPLERSKLGVTALPAPTPLAPARPPGLECVPVSAPRGKTYVALRLHDLPGIGPRPVRTLELDGASVHYEDLPGVGPADILLLPGIAGSFTDFARVDLPLTRFGRVLGLDFPGFGRSPRGNRTADVDSQGEVAVAVLDRVVKKPAIVVASSMGALVALHAASARPERVAAVVLLNGALPVPFGLGATVSSARALVSWVRMGWDTMSCLRLRQGAKGGLDFTLVPERIVASAMRFAEGADIDSALLAAEINLYEDVLQRSGREHVRTFVEALYSAVRKMLSPKKVYDTINALPMPVIALHGTKDRVVPVAALSALRANCPRCTVQPLPNVGHLPHLEAPDVVIRVVRDALDGVASRPR